MPCEPRRKLVMGLLVAALVLVPTPRARALTVFDPANLAQNLLQATRALEQINNQIRQIDQASAMLQQNPLQLSPELVQSIAEARELFTLAQGLAFQVDRLSEDLRTLYPETWDALGLEDIGERSDNWLRESRAALERAMAAEARSVQAIERAQGNIDRALQSSVGSQGQTGAVQAGNQLLGIQASQLVEIHALLIAQGRALETERLERIAREQRAGEIQRRAFPTETTRTLDPARSAFGP